MNVRDRRHTLHDVYSVGPDGTDLRQLTSDGISSGTTWTSAGRIRFKRIPIDQGNMEIEGEARFWVMDADGGNAVQLDPSPDVPADTAWQPTP